MNIHKNARLTPHGRAELARRVASGQEPGVVAAAFGIDVKTVRKWAARFAAEGVAGLADRSSRPHKLNRPTPVETLERIVALRRDREQGGERAVRCLVRIPRLAAMALGDHKRPGEFANQRGVLARHRLLAVAEPAPPFVLGVGETARAGAFDQAQLIISFTDRLSAA